MEWGRVTLWSHGGQMIVITLCMNPPCPIVLLPMWGRCWTPQALWKILRDSGHPLNRPTWSPPLMRFVYCLFSVWCCLLYTPCFHVSDNVLSCFNVFFGVRLIAHVCVRSMFGRIFLCWQCTTVLGTCLGMLGRASAANEFNSLLMITVCSTHHWRSLGIDSMVVLSPKQRFK